MTHPAELSLHQFMTDAVKGKTTMPKDVIRQVGRDVTAALKRQFSSGISRDKFSLRMSNIGRPTCQLWFQKNKPELAEPKPTNFLMNMLLGDIVEAVFKGLLKAAGVEYTDSKKTKLKLKEGVVTGSYDLIIDGDIYNSNVLGLFNTVQTHEVTINNLKSEIESLKQLVNNLINN